MENTLKGISGLAIRGSFFRFLRKKHSGNPLSMEGSLKIGGRYNPRDKFGALYLSDSHETSVREIFRNQRNADLGKYDIHECEVNLQNVLDLTDKRILKLLRKRRFLDLINDDWTVTQVIGSAARQAGFEAIIYPSATGSGKSLAVFADRLKEGSSLASKSAENNQDQ